MANEQTEHDEVIQVLEGLRAEALAAFASFQKKLAAKSFATPMDVASEMSDLFSLVVDLSEKSLGLHVELLEWRAGVDEELDALAGGESALVPSDALKLKTLLLELFENLRPATGPEDQVPDLLRSNITQTLSFIDEITIEPGDGDDEDEEGDEDDEDEDKT